MKVVSKLTSHDVKFAVVGGYAVALHGAVRGTVDLDLVLILNKENLMSAEKALNELGLQSLLPLKAADIFEYRTEYIKNRNLIAWSFVNPRDPSQVVDLIITFDLKKMSVVQKSIGGQKIPVLSKRDLIKMKKASGRPQDLEDVQALEDLDDGKS